MQPSSRASARCGTSGSGSATLGTGRERPLELDACARPARRAGRACRPRRGGARARSVPSTRTLAGSQVDALPGSASPVADRGRDVERELQGARRARRSGAPRSRRTAGDAGRRLGEPLAELPSAARRSEGLGGAGGAATSARAERERRAEDRRPRTERAGQRKPSATAASTPSRIARSSAASALPHGGTSQRRSISPRATGPLHSRSTWRHDQVGTPGPVVMRAFGSTTSSLCFGRRGPRAGARQRLDVAPEPRALRAGGARLLLRPVRRPAVRTPAPRAAGRRRGRAARIIASSSCA